MKIGVDIDGVVADFVGSFLPELNKYCNCSSEDIVNYDFEKNIKINITDSQNKELWGIINKNKLYSKLKLIKGCEIALSDIIKNNSIILISSRKKEIRGDTLAWLKKYKISFSKLKLFDSKKEKIKAMSKCDIVLEDDLEVARALSALDVQVLLFDYPWNRIGSNIKRIKSWGQALKIIKRPMVSSV
ncbi:MAG: hypothetical protein WC543_05260 [Candidatus Omnitrophota bacterium]